MIEERHDDRMDYPQWLLPAYIRSARAAGATASDEELTKAAVHLIGRWNAPDRHHHGVHHLCDMLSRITTLAPETHNPELVSLAAFYHGCVFSTADKETYTRNGGENEVESARVARSELTSIGIAPGTASRVADLISGMKKKPKEVDPTSSATLSALDIDKLALRDSHLGALAAGPQKYTKYLDQVAKEYSHVPEEDFLLARREILGKLLARRQIFLSPLGRQWEAPARDNLEGELERIEARLQAIAGRTPKLQVEPPVEWEHPTSGRSEDAQGALTPEEYAESRTAVASPRADRIPDAEVAPTPAHESRIPPTPADRVIRSSLETLPEDSEPGVPPRSLKGEEKKRAEREEIARKMQERISRRQARRAVDDEPHRDSAANPDTPAPAPQTAQSANTPEWHDDDNSDRAGFEREPDY